MLLSPLGQLYRYVKVIKVDPEMPVPRFTLRSRPFSVETSYPMKRIRASPLAASC